MLLVGFVGVGSHEKVQNITCKDREMHANSHIVQVLFTSAHLAPIVSGQEKEYVIWELPFGKKGKGMGESCIIWFGCVKVVLGKKRIEQKLKEFLFRLERNGESKLEEGC